MSTGVGRRGWMASLSDNAQGAVWIVVAMIGYVINDAFIKLAAEDVPLFQAIFIRGVMICALLSLFARPHLGRHELRDVMTGPVQLRVLAEMVGTVCFLIALTHMEFANVVAIMQFVPLAVLVAAAVMLGETVDWVRRLSVLVGFFGVMLIVRPGTDGFDAWSILVFCAVGCVLFRELATHRIEAEVPTILVTLATGIGITVLAGVVSIFEGWIGLSGREIGLLATCAVFLGIGYHGSVSALRVGDVSYTASYRYTIMVFAIILQIVVFGDVPDGLTLVGSAVITAAGLWAFSHERSVSRARQFETSPAPGPA